LDAELFAEKATPPFGTTRQTLEKIKMKTARTLALLILAGLVSAGAQAQFRKPEEAVKYRQGVMNVMDFHLYRQIGSMVNGRIPFDAKAAVENANLVAAMSHLPWMAFGPGFDVGKHDAKPAVWTEQARFKDLSEKMQAEVVKLQAASRTGDLEALKTAYRAASNSCKACHDRYTSQ
jgi:cytochrome c556